MMGGMSDMVTWLRAQVKDWERWLTDPREANARAASELALINLHDDLHDCVTEAGSQVFPAGVDDEIPCPVLQWLAYGYRHRPGYLTLWVPEGADDKPPT